MAVHVINEARRCLQCKKPLCRLKGCPAQTNIPEMIRLFLEGNINDAGAMLFANNPMSVVCSLVCDHEAQCEGHCIQGRKGAPVQISSIEHYISDTYLDKVIMEHEPAKGQHVAIIGSGPAGLTVAGDLARQGFNVVIFEGQEEAGGVLMYGIPEYRLPKAVVRKEIERIEQLGVRFVRNCLVGSPESGVTVDSLFADGFDAIFMGTGTALPRQLKLPGATLKRVTQSTDFLHNVNAWIEGALPREMVPLRDGEHVAVIGGGNVAMDAARTARRLGADVTVIYRRTQAEMTAIQSEYDEAVKEGVHFMWQSESQEFIGNERGRVCAIRLATPEGERTVPFDRVFLAIGSRPASRIVSTTTGIEVDEKGYVKVGERPYGMTTRRGVFAGGDVVHRPQTVVLAMKAAKDVAVGIAQYVDAIKLLEACGE